VREPLRSFYARVEHGFEGASLPAFVRADLEGHVHCGVLGRGFAQGALNLLTYVLPAVPLRQWS
jgi:hypothetical protein